MDKQIQSALVSVYHKDNLAPIIELLAKANVQIYSTGGTYDFILELGYQATAVEKLTQYPAILGGRVKTLHPAIFGGILQRRSYAQDVQEAIQYSLPAIDLVIVDLYPFGQTVASGAEEEDIIEKIDIGGVSLIRAAAKNFEDVLVVSSVNQYTKLIEILQIGISTDLPTRRRFAAEAFMQTAQYDSAIFNWFEQKEQTAALQISYGPGQPLRYGENPHQKGLFYGNLDQVFEQLHGKEISYNNLVDIEACLALVADLSEPNRVSCAIIKHTNACGVALAETGLQAYNRALACDPVSAFGGVIGFSGLVDVSVAQALDSLFFEVLAAPDFEPEALKILQKKKNRIIIRVKSVEPPKAQYKSLLGGLLYQQADTYIETQADLKTVTIRQPDAQQIQALLFAIKIAKHTKSNTIVLANSDGLIASGTGQTSRIDALHQAIDKAKHFGFSLKGAVMASDAFFPFSDCVEIAGQAGIEAVIQPGGSVRDQDSILECDRQNMAMVLTNIRHFKH